MVWRFALSTLASFLFSVTGKPLPLVSLLHVSLHLSTCILENHIPQWQKPRRKSVSKGKWSTLMRVAGKSSRERRKNHEWIWLNEGHWEYWRGHFGGAVWIKAELEWAVGWMTNDRGTHRDYKQLIHSRSFAYRTPSYSKCSERVILGFQKV